MIFYWSALTIFCFIFQQLVSPVCFVYGQIEGEESIWHIWNVRSQPITNCCCKLVSFRAVVFFLVIFMNLALICNASFNLFPWHFIFILNYVDFGLLFLCVNLLLVPPSEIRLTETERYTQFVCILLCIRAFRFAGFFLFSFAWFCVSNSLFIHVN